ncbi:hypothetical protein Tco_1220187 [Tanacetum coccineum]
MWMGESPNTTTFAAFPGNILVPSPGTCRRELYSHSTCHREDYDGEATTGIESPAIFPDDDTGPTPFSVNENVGSLILFPIDMSPGIGFIINSN